MRPRLDFRELFAFARRLGGPALNELRREILGALSRAGAKTMAHARMKAPRFTGELTNSIFATGPFVQEVPGSIVYQELVQATAPHGIVMEEGREAGAAMPPLGPIRRWVALRAARGDMDLAWTGRQGEAAIDRAAWLVALSIRRKGIRARRFMEAAADIGHRELEEDMVEVARRWAERVE